MHYNNRINNITNLQPNKNQAMTDFEIKRSLIEDDFTTNCLVTFLKLICNRIEVDTVSEMARKEGKSPQGIRVSKRYTKIKIGKQTMVIKNESENN